MLPLLIVRLMDDLSYQPIDLRDKATPGMLGLDPHRPLANFPYLSGHTQSVGLKPPARNLDDAGKRWRAPIHKHILASNSSLGLFIAIVNMSDNCEERSSPLGRHGRKADSSIHVNTNAYSPTTSSGPVRKTRVALACKRCKRRKQRCDGSDPACKSCKKADVPCVYEKNIRPQYPGGKSLYINALEERIAFLEARLPAYAEDHYGGASSLSPHDTNGTANFRQRHDSTSSHMESVSEDLESEGRHSIVDGVAYLSLCASGTTDTAPEPFYLGSSSGAAIARMIQKSIFRNPSKRAVAHTIRSAHGQQGGAANAHLQATARPSMPEELPFDMPPKDQAQLLKAYSVIFENQYERGALSITQRSIMHLIYAIAARFLQLTRKPCGVESEKHLIAAIEPMDYILEQHNLGTVQFLLLLAVHGQRSPYGAGAWSQVSVVLGRAFAIADRDINVALPKTDIEFWDLTHKEPPEGHGQLAWSNIEPFIHIIKLDRMLSRIHRIIYRVDQDVFSGTPTENSKLEKKMATIRNELDNWIQTIPQSPKGSHKINWLYDPESASHDSQDFFNLQYHKAVLMLFTVLLPTLQPSDHRFVATARSAACVCIAYKRLNQAKTLTYTMISLHSCFVAGLTLVYCLWRDRNLFSYDVFEATQACSQSLTIFGEKWSGAVKYRDIFDALSGSLFKTLVNPLVPSNSTGLNLGNDTQPMPLRASFDAGASACHSFTSLDNSRPQEEVQEPAMRNLMSDAVRDAFMEVDEEVPGGWQGWRMWNEMLGEENPSQSSTVFNATSSDELSSGWLGSHNKAETLPDVAMVQTDQYTAADASEWDFGNA
ncbi:transcriptional regulatory protein [Paramyrothecium foliicola]|nr:transcriptional regulatory protein [Paramyrothecium foliicola]